MMFQRQPTLASLLPLLDQLMDLSRVLEAQHGSPTYFPFYRYGGMQIRTQQAYFVKFPVELFKLIPGIESARLSDLDVEDADVPEDFQPAGKKAPHGRTTRAQDPKLRAAIERRALDVALVYYEGLGGIDATELGKPYDIAVTVDGIERHCEVKGSSMLIDAVELTINEVNHGRDYAHVDLIVVDGIDVSRDNATGEMVATGGTRRIWKNWSPAQEALTARRFTYMLPNLLGIRSDLPG
jgi:hypothetical protein